EIPGGPQSVDLNALSRRRVDRRVLQGGERRNVDQVKIIERRESYRNKDDANQTGEKRFDPASRIQIREQQQMEKQDLCEFDGDVEYDFDPLKEHIRDEVYDQDTNSEDEDRSLPQSLSGQLREDFVPRQDDARNDRNEVKVQLQPRYEIRGPD